MPTYQIARRIAISIAGATVILIGVALLVLPGPGLVVIAVGLGILSLEFAWARYWLKRMKTTGTEIAGHFYGSSKEEQPTEDKSQTQQHEARDHNGPERPCNNPLPHSNAPDTR